MEGDHVTVPEIGYDRLLTFGDNSWSSFEAEIPITINSFDPAGYAAPSGGPGVGFIPHWRGHTQVGTDQPKWGFSGQLGALVWYRYRDDQNSERLEIRDSNALLVADDLSAFQLSTGVTYIFKLQAETGGGAGPLYRLKVWEQGTPEPADWNIVTSLPPGAPDTGALALVAHHVDADFGNLEVRQLSAVAPTVTPAQGTYTGLAKVEMSTPTRAGEIRYTLDGSEPTETSPLYTEPFFVTDSITIKARTFRVGFISSGTTQRTYSILEPPDRIEEDLQAIYRFDEDGGNVIHDSAQVGAPLDVNIEPGSNVTWLPDVDALRINAASILRTPAGANRINSGAIASQSFTVEAWIDPATLDAGNATLFNLGSTAPGQQNLALTQQGRGLDINVRTTSTNADGVPNRNTGSILPPQLQHVVYVRRPDNTSLVYVDGQMVWSNFLGGSLTSWAAGYGLAIANSVEGVDPWIGDLYLMAVYTDDLTDAEIINNYQSGPYPPPANYAPQIEAGPDITLVEGEVAQMAAFAADDGNPVPPGALTTQWTQISGPATAGIANSSSPTTTVTFPVGGDYVFRWTGFDGVKTTTDDMVISVIPAGSTAPAPFVTPGSGSYPGEATVEMTSSVPGAEIRFTVDGSDPTADSTLYTGPFPINFSQTIKARVYRVGLAESPITTRGYVITVDSRVLDGVVAFYPFNEDNGTTIKDRSAAPGILNLEIENIGKVTRVPSGVRIDQPTLITSTNNAGKITNPVAASHGVTMEMWISPTDVTQLNAMIGGISANPNARNIGVIENGTGLSAYLRSSATNSKGEPPTTVANALTASMMHVVYTRDPSGFTKIYVNSALVAEGFVAGNLGNWVSTQKVHLGGERDGTRSWLGTYYLVAFYSRALTHDEVVQNFAYGDV